MGLDQYLTAKRYLWEHKDQEKQVAEKLAQIAGVPDGFRVKQLECEAMYWRKANAIHKWFVDNVQDGTDDCGTYWVSQDNLEQLLSVIETVLQDRSHAMTLLPPTSGFFFGSTEIDEWYWHDLEQTRDRLRTILAQDNTGWDFEYHSSW
jgi:hypothetical protein